MEKDTVGRNPLLVSRFMRKIQHRMIEQAKGEIEADEFPSLLLINQIRMKVGVMFGSPEVLPGGMAQNYAQTLRIRLYGKDVVDTKIHPTLPLRKAISGTIQKYKCPIVSKKFEFELAMVDHSGLEVGHSYDWPGVKTYAENYGLLTKVKNGYMFFGEEYKTQKEIAAKVASDSSFRDEVLQSFLAKLLDNPLNVDGNTKVK